MAIDPTHPDLSQIMAQIEKLPQAEQSHLYQVLSAKLTNGTTEGADYVPLQAGWAKELIVSIADDFDAPLPEMKEYME